ncbi:hypothetical protein SeMB42_g06411 [Synchytrium endobioticum]|uniref:cysteine synthase n=1 Tax=Synchytrium endobioticum TaxID=286115 RepID=A0A507CL53_9FUNG|nr:hypothetical protein SeMB42_g06411 [Synchytrium endobioticum]
MYKEAFIQGLACGSIVASIIIKQSSRRSDASTRAGSLGLVGNTPIITIRSLSTLTGCQILAKCEFLSLAGSSKDRVALNIIEHAEEEGLITPHTGCTLFEGTMGSTGISLTTIGRAKGYKVHVVLPDDTAREKYELITALGATVERVRPVSIIDRNHFVNVAQRRAEEMSLQAAQTRSQAKGYFCDQFENLANFQAHYNTTGPEIYQQCGTDIHAFVMGAGTGGTIAGVSRYLKPRIPNIKIVLADPQGSGLYHRVLHGVLYSATESEGTRKRHQVDTIVEGIGINRITMNWKQLEIGRGETMQYVDDAVRVSDQEAVDMSRYLMAQEGLFLGSSSAVNLVAAVRVARTLGPGHSIVTLLCDSGSRHLTKFWNDDYLKGI